MFGINAFIYHTSDDDELHVMEVIGMGSFGRVSKRIWRGSVVAAKEIPTVGNQKSLQNELNVYRYENILWSQLFGFAFMVVNFIHRTLNHPNILSLLGIITRKESVVLITNFVRGNNFHNVIFNSNKAVSAINLCDCHFSPTGWKQL